MCGFKKNTATTPTQMLGYFFFQMWSWGQCLSAKMSDTGSPQGLNFSQSSEHLPMKYGKSKDWKIEACLFVTIKKVVKWLFRMS